MQRRRLLRQRGPSGRNVDYLYRLDGWLLQHGIRDDHVRAIAKLVHEREEAEEESRVCEDEPCAAAQGRVVVDDGAAEVVSNCGRSLLAVGVVRVVGDFGAGATPRSCPWWARPSRRGDGLRRR